MKRKHIFAAALAAAAICAAAPAASALTLEYDNKVVDYRGSIYRLFINNSELTDLPLSPIIFNDRAVVPVREIFEGLGAKVDYNGMTQCVEVVYNGTYIRMYINNNMAYVNGKKTAVPGNVVPKLIAKQGGETKTMVPVRFISETVGLDVDFDAVKGAIYVGNQPEEVTEAAEPEEIEEIIEAEPEETPVPTPAPAKKPAEKAEQIPDEDIGKTGVSPSEIAKRAAGNEEGITGATKDTKFVMVGADVSHWQGKINWAKAKDEIDFAILNLGYGQDIESQDDKQFARNAAECKKYGIPYGAYIYSYADTVEKAKGEAEHAIRVLKGYDLSFPVYYDLEDDSQKDLSPKLLGQMAKVFCDNLKAAGYEVGIYANTTWWTNKLTDRVFNDPTWYKWVAQYNTKCTYSGKYTMWQYTDSQSVTGMEGGIDMNYWYGRWRE